MRKLFLLLFAFPLFAEAQTILIPYGSSWYYLDNGSNQGTAWRTSTNNTGWKVGNAELGYGDGDEATIVGFGSNSKKKYITTYFRQLFSITNPSQFNSLTLSLRRDDGAVVYVNGTEVFRTNMPTGAVSYTTKASGDAADDGDTDQNVTLNSSSFINGNNIIAVEIHQSNANDPDISFDLRLTGTTGSQTATLTRGPYLNMVNGSAATIRWRTNIATDSKIEVGTGFGTYTLVATDAAATTEHEVRITGLTEDTKYYYRFGSNTQVLQAGSDNFFRTAPAANVTRKMRFVAFGDCGRGSATNQDASLAAYRNFLASNNIDAPDAWLLMGDNAYNAGTDGEYTTNFFNIYQSNIAKNHIVFPSPGNHDYANSSTRQVDHNIPYYSIFTLPTAGQVGGTPSGTEAYYSWDWGNIHFLALDSYGKENGGTTSIYDTTAGSAQMDWIRTDLAANTKKWVIAYWHHPPYTMGSHNSDTESDLVAIRQKTAKVLERLGVDVIINGHSHVYERSYLLDGHYGLENTFNASTMAKSTSSAKYDGSINSCPYTTTSGQANKGTVYVVAGSAGSSLGQQASFPHAAMSQSLVDAGVFYFEVEDNRLDAKFIRDDGSIWDKFTIIKDVNKNNVISLPSGFSTILTASWLGSYNWSTGETTRSINVNPSANTTYYVNDPFSCLKDTFNVMVDAAPITMKQRPNAQENAFTIQPTLVKRGQNILINTITEGKMQFAITDVTGRIITTISVNGSLSYNTAQLNKGYYFLRWSQAGKMQTKRFVVVE